jgi:hypothetical protein
LSFRLRFPNNWGIFHADIGYTVLISQLEGMMDIQTGKFTIDGETVYNGVTMGDHWNGWEVPYFTAEVAQKIAADTSTSAGDPTTRPGLVGLFPVGGYEWTWAKV